VLIAGTRPADGGGLRNRWTALRRRVGWIDHLARTFGRYVAYRGYQQAASITYFSVLSLVPVAMVVLSVAGYLLSGHPALLDQLRADITDGVPTATRPLVVGLVNNVIDHRFGLGILGIAVAGYCGWNWMNALRDALTGMWRLRREDEPVVLTVAKDLATLAGLGVALLVMYALTALGAGVLGPALNAAGMPASGWQHAGLALGSVVITVVTDWLVFWWVLATVPRVPVPPGAARWPALVTAIGFELLKRLGNVYLELLGHSPTGLVLGSVAGVLVFAYLVARLLLLAAAWIATNNNTTTSTTSTDEPARPVDRSPDRESRAKGGTPQAHPAAD
jgi:membrane protein